ncbi:MAG TPA: CPBP family intramembrane glutamic endopeptidase [Candidatus Limnocylindrales bacterium]|jgi:membrane protease YdiL (CAAX protease family)
MTLTLENLIILATVGLLLLLRFDAARFGAADFDDEESPGGLRTRLGRLSWYVFGVFLIVVVYFLYPQPLSELHLQMGDPRLLVFVAGIGLALIGMAYAALYAWWRYGDFKFPPVHRYPAGILNALATAFIDEATWRGILMGLLLESHWPVWGAIGFQAVLYALATRLGSPGRPRAMLWLSLAIGIVGGWITVITGGIGAILLAHAVTRFAIFVATGHAGQVTPSAAFDEDVVEEDSKITPQGWEVVGENQGR